MESPRSNRTLSTPTPVDGDLEQTQAYRVSVQPLGPPQLTRRDPQQRGSHLQENNRPAYSHHGNRRPMNSRQMDDNRPWRDYQQTNRRQGSPMNAFPLIGGHAVQYGQQVRSRAFRGTARVVEVEDMEAQAQRRGRSNRSGRDSYHALPRALPKVRSYSPQHVEPPSRATGPKFQGAKASIHIRGRGNRAQVKQSHSTFRTLGKHFKTELDSEPSDYPRSISRTPPRKEGNVKVEKRSASPNRARSISLIPSQNEVKVKLEPRSEPPEPMRRATSLSVGDFIKTEPESEAPEPVSTLMVAPALVESKARSETTEPMNQSTNARASGWVTIPLAGIKRYVSSGFLLVVVIYVYFPEHMLIEPEYLQKARGLFYLFIRFIQRRLSGQRIPRGAVQEG